MLLNIAETWRTDGDCDAAREPLELALATFEELGDNHGAGVALTALGNLAAPGRPTRPRRASTSTARWRCAEPPATRARSRRRCSVRGCSTLREGDTRHGPALVGRANAIFERTARTCPA